MATDDAYAKKYMAGAGAVLLRDTKVGRTSLAILGLVTLWCGGGAIGAFLNVLPKSSVGAAVFMTFMTAFFAFLALTLTVVRTVVSEGEVQVQCGLWGPRVPMERVTSCRVVPYDWVRFAGWGIKRSADGTWAYTLDAKSDVVELTWTDEAGEAHAAQFSASDPHAVAAAVEKARATRLRIAVDDEAVASDRAIVEAAAEEAEEAAEGTARRNS
ncbi:MAG: hypothetical protein JNL79_04690 [Myxococcales bacterium]|nr:hypothetical protein [Myxococcales bacterium]